jgi:hypothetical protein
MDVVELTNKILLINPDAKFCVRKGLTADEIKNSLDEVMQIDDLHVVWNRTNEKEMPSVDEINAVTKQDADNEEASRSFKERMNFYKSDLYFKAAFLAYKSIYEAATFEEFLLAVETLNVDE